ELLGYGPMPSLGAVLLCLALQRWVPPLRPPLPLAIGAIFAHFMLNNLGWMPLPDLRWRLGAVLLVEATLLGVLAGSLRAFRPSVEEEEDSGWMPWIAGFFVAVTAVAWALTRPQLDPSPGAFAAGLVALWLGSMAPRRLWPLGLAGLLPLIQPSFVSDLTPYAGLIVYTAAGLGLGLLLAGSRGRGALEGMALAVGAVALLPTLPAAQVAPLVSGSWSVAPAERESLAKMRENRPLVYGKLGWYGSTGLRQSEQHLRLELDGQPVDTAGRLGQAERFGGFLAGCLAPNHGSVQVLGDDLGLVTLALRGQGFDLIDVAAPDGALLRAQALALPTLQQAWVDPRVRIWELPGSFLGRFGGEADASVQILRSPWAAPVAQPDAEVRVLVLHLLDLERSDFAGVIRRFTAGAAHSSLWMPPTGVDSAILAVHPTPIPWERLERCVQAGRTDMRIFGLESALDLSALALVENPTLPDWDFRGGRFLTPVLWQPPQLHLSRFREQDVSFLQDAPPERAARVKTRTAFLSLLETAAQGATGEALAQARVLSEEPGGDRALAPLVAPYLRDTKAAMEQKDWTKAGMSLSTGLALFPGSAELWCLQGRLELARERWDASITAFNSCLERDDGRLEGLDGLALAWKQKGEGIEVEKTLRRALSLHPELWTTSHNLGFFLLEQGRVEEAERLLRQAAARSAASSSPSSLPDLALARLYLATNRPPLAMAQAERALSRGPSADAYFYKGAAATELNQLDPAEAAFLAALELRPDYILARGGLGQVQAMRGQYKLAAESFTAVLAKDPQNAQAKENLRRLQPFLR
ncbi:MAG TPA: tetratricopeptide repeat protein, partial [Myxococcota bacterium]|nr:tetratricopeptide repeat protein [Myxococcota bacterium]